MKLGLERGACNTSG